MSTWTYINSFLPLYEPKESKTHKTHVTLNSHAEQIHMLIKQKNTAIPLIQEADGSWQTFQWTHCGLSFVRAAETRWILL